MDLSMDTYGCLEIYWREIDREVYSTIYNFFHKELHVHSCHTCMDGCYFHGEPNLMTAWGFQDSDAPLIKHHKIGNEHYYYIAEVKSNCVNR